MDDQNGYTRRHFLATAIAAAGATTLRTRAATSPATYRRANVMSADGQKALASYAKGVEAMLKLPVSHPHNWFRHAFVHLMDCPHANWWFYAWHRAYLAHCEQIIRKLSGDSMFAMPYWDWTAVPKLPDGLFDGVLSPTDQAYAPVTRNLAVFTGYIKPTLNAYWATLQPMQLAQLQTRGYTNLDMLWNEVTGYDPHLTPPHAVAHNIAFAPTGSARYLTRDNPKFDAKTASNTSVVYLYCGLLATVFNNPNPYLSFTSTKTASHNTPPNGNVYVSSVIEGYMHNRVHNFIGGNDPLFPGPYGNMTNNLSPVDPCFFLHHANMDRLWDLWIRKQKSISLPYLPTGNDLTTFANEPFLFFVDANANAITTAKAGDYLDIGPFDYDYEPGSGEDVISSPAPAPTEQQLTMRGTIKGNTASASIPGGLIKRHLSARTASLVAEITIRNPAPEDAAREFDIIVGAPPDVTHVDADSPYYAGTFSFYGMSHMMMTPNGTTTFAAPLPRGDGTFPAGAAATTGNVPMNVRIVPTRIGSPMPRVMAVTIRVR